jgi:hypothetical protein
MMHKLIVLAASTPASCLLIKAGVSIWRITAYVIPAPASDRPVIERGKMLAGIV